MDVIPDYAGHSLVNLMSSIASSLELNSPYPELMELNSIEIQQTEKVVLIVVDGLGYNYLKKKLRSSNLQRNLHGKMTSVYPATTATAVSTFFSGLPAQQHAVTGWWVYLKEWGIVTVILPFMSILGGTVLNAEISEVIDVDRIFTKCSYKYSVILGTSIVHSTFSRHMTGGAKRKGYRNIDEFFESIQSCVQENGHSYTYAYWPKLDDIGHRIGIMSNDAIAHLEEFDARFGEMIDSIDGTNTTVILTSDHGLTDSTSDSKHYTGDHPVLYDTLALPLCGDARSAYCYIRPSKVEVFERYIERNLSESFDLHKSIDLIEDNWFGLYEPHPKLKDRIGDYTLIARNNNVLLHSYQGLPKTDLVGFHGGTTEDEMYVPLIVKQC